MILLHIWSPYSSPFTQLIIDFLFNSSELPILKAIQPITPIDCYQHITAISCNSAFPPCQNVFVPELNHSGNVIDKNVSFIFYSPLVFLPVALAMPPCKAFCKRTNQLCSEYCTYFYIFFWDITYTQIYKCLIFIFLFKVKSYARPPFDCDQVDPYTQLERWPEEHEVIEIDGVRLNSSCSRDLPLPSILFLNRDT